MTGHRERPARHGPRGPRTARTLRVEAIWEDGPRNEAWDELWRRLLEAVFRRIEEEARNGANRGEYDSGTDLPPDTSPSDG